MWQLSMMLNGIDDISTAPFTRILGYTTLELEVLLALVRNEMKDRSVHTFYE